MFKPQPQSDPVRPEEWNWEIFKYKEKKQMGIFSSKEEENRKKGIGTKIGKFSVMGDSRFKPQPQSDPVRPEKWNQKTKKGRAFFFSKFKGNKGYGGLRYGMVYHIGERKKG